MKLEPALPSPPHTDRDGRPNADFLERSTETFQTQRSLERMSVQQERGRFPLSFQRPQGFQLELTSRCNLRCQHCYNTSGVGYHDDMSPSEWDRIIEEIAGLDPFQVIFSGGEPLLLGDRLFSYMDRLSTGLARFVLITNGWLASPEKIERLCRYRYHWLQVSIDGFQSEVHDEFRGAEGSWERAVRAAHGISSRSQALVVAHTVHPGNVWTLPQMIDLALVLGACRIVCDGAMSVGRAYEERERLDLTAEQRQFMAETILDKQQEYENRMEVLRTSDLANSFALNSELPCNVLLIRPNGDVKLDCVMPFVIGNLRRQSLMEIWEAVGREAWKHPRISKFVEDYRSHNGFSECEARPYVTEDIYLEAAP